MNNRIAVLAIYNNNRILRPHIVKLIDDLSESCDKLVCVCESNDRQIISIRNITDKLIYINTRKLCRGEAYWNGVKYLLKNKLIKESQDLILCDTNLYSCFSDFSVFIEEVSSKEEDIISLFSRQDREIIGSFLYIKSTLIYDGPFLDYWNDYRFPSLFRLGQDFFDNDFLDYFRKNNFSLGSCCHIKLDDSGKITAKTELGYSGVFISEDLVESPGLLYDAELIQGFFPSAAEQTDKLIEYFETKYVDHCFDNSWEGLLSWVNDSRRGNVYVFCNKGKTRAGVIDLFKVFGIGNTVRIDSEDELTHIVFQKCDGFIIDGEIGENSEALEIVLRYIPYNILYYHNISGKSLIIKKAYVLAVKRLIWNNISKIKRIKIWFR